MQAKHTITQIVHGTNLVSDEDKAGMITTLEAIDKTDWMKNTILSCEAATPTIESKTATWKKLLDPNSGLSKEQ